MIENAIRSLFWAIAHLFLAAGDWVYEIMNAVLSLDLTNSKVIMYTWSFMLLFLTFATFVRIFFVIMHRMADDDEFEIDEIFRKLGTVFLVVAISATFFNVSLVAPGYVVRSYNNVVTYDERMTTSSAVISSTAKTPISAALTDMSSTDEIISIETINRKLNDVSGGEYIYFKGYAELLLCIIGAFAVAVLQINIVQDLVIRLFLNIFRFVIGFIPISSIVEEDSTCGLWIKDILCDAIVMMFIPISLNMLFGLMSTSGFTALNGIVRLVIFVAALGAIRSACDMIANYIGASRLRGGGNLGSKFLTLGTFAAMHGAMDTFKGMGKYGLAGAKGITDKIGTFTKGGKFGEAIDPEGVLGGVAGAAGMAGAVGAVNGIAGAVGAMAGGDTSSVLDQNPTSAGGFAGADVDSRLNGLYNPGGVDDRLNSLYSGGSSSGLGGDLGSGTADDKLNDLYTGSAAAGIGAAAMMGNMANNGSVTKSSGSYKENSGRSSGKGRTGGTHTGFVDGASSGHAYKTKTGGSTSKYSNNRKSGGRTGGAGTGDSSNDGSGTSTHAYAHQMTGSGTVRKEKDESRGGQLSQGKETEGRGIIKDSSSGGGSHAYTQQSSKKDNEKILSGGQGGSHSFTQTKAGERSYERKTSSSHVKTGTGRGTGTISSHTSGRDVSKELEKFDFSKYDGDSILNNKNGGNKL